jgi:hypothetical protein
VWKLILTEISGISLDRMVFGFTSTYICIQPVYHRKTLVKDDEGREVPALDIFSMVIKYLKKHLLDTLETRGTGQDNNDIHWVLTVPAIWTEPAMMTMYLLY